MSTIAIIGAGMSGLAAAHTLRDAGHTVSVYEQAAIPGGRATSRTRQGFTYDSGAQYIKQGSSTSMALLTQRFRLPDLFDIVQPVWIFDGQGRIQAGDPTLNAEPKWNYHNGLLELSTTMALALGKTIHYNTNIQRLEQTSAGWTLLTLSDIPVGTFERVLVTLPAPQALELIERSQIDATLQQHITQQLAEARYNPIFSVILAYDFAPRARPYYALVNTDKAHAISWLAWEHIKSPTRVPERSGLLIAQMAPNYSRDHQDAADAEIVQDTAQRVSDLLNETLTTPLLTEVVRWQDALPTTRADAEELNALALPHGLAFCGDAFVGGRVHLAIEHGLHVAGQMS